MRDKFVFEYSANYYAALHLTFHKKLVKCQLNIIKHTCTQRLTEELEDCFSVREILLYQAWANGDRLCILPPLKCHPPALLKHCLPLLY